MLQAAEAEESAALDEFSSPEVTSHASPQEGLTVDLATLAKISAPSKNAYVEGRVYVLDLVETPLTRHRVIEVTAICKNYFTFG